MIVADLEIAVKRSKRKTVSIFIERDGTVSALVPDRLSDDEVAKVIESKSYQIHRNLAQWTQLNEAYVEREYVSGQSFLYLGRNYRLKVLKEESEGLILRNGYFFLSDGNKAKAKDLFVAFYKEKLLSKLDLIIERYAARMGVSVKELRVMELQNRWASCTSKGSVNFHWKCAMAPIDVLNYIVVHELAHLLHANHTTAFWNEVDKVMPNYEKQVNWLKLNGAGMTL